MTHRRLFHSLVTLFAALFFLDAAQAQLPRAGAPRALEIVDERGEPLGGSLLGAKWRGRAEITFTREANGTRNLWRATPQKDESRRYPAWRARPLTKLEAPSRAEFAAPLPDDDDLICVSNATGENPTLARFDPRRNRFRALVEGFASVGAPVVSPDGRFVAFDGQNAGGKGIFVLGLSDRTPRRWQTPLLVVADGRRATWLDARTLCFESTRPGARGLFRFSLPLEADAPISELLVAPQPLLLGGGEPSALPKGAGVIFAARKRDEFLARLYVLASDGAGLRALTSPLGARRPHVAPDASAVVFDAPLEILVEGEADDESAAHGLWILPLLQPTEFAAQDLDNTLLADNETLAAPDAAFVRVAAAPLPTPTPMAVAPTVAAAPVSAAPVPEFPVQGSGPLAPFSPGALVSVARLPDLPPPPASSVQKVEANSATIEADEPANSRAFAGVCTVGGVAPQLRGGETVRAAFWAWNRGATLWETGSSGPNRVRVVARWISTESETRSGWQFFWLSEGVAPDAQTRRECTLRAPTRAGRYRLVFGLVSLPSQGEYKAPPYNASQSEWPSEFARAALEVEVVA